MPQPSCYRNINGQLIPIDDGSNAQHLTTWEAQLGALELPTTRGVRVRQPMSNQPSSKGVSSEAHISQGKRSPRKKTIHCHRENGSECIGYHA